MVRRGQKFGSRDSDGKFCANLNGPSPAFIIQKMSRYYNLKLRS